MLLKYTNVLKNLSMIVRVDYFFVSSVNYITNWSFGGSEIFRSIKDTKERVGCNNIRTKTLRVLLPTK